MKTTFEVLLNQVLDVKTHFARECTMQFNEANKIAEEIFIGRIVATLMLTKWEKTCRQ